MDLRLAYLVSQYPAIPHGYILGEIRNLRGLGVDLHVASVRPPDRPSEKLTAVEREEHAQTFCIKSAGIAAALRAHLRTLLTRPLAYVRGLFDALTLSRGNPKTAAHNLLYFAEAIILGHWMLSRSLSHVHIHYATTVGLLAGRIFPITVSSSIHGSGEFVDPAGFYIPQKIAASLFIRAISQYGRSQLMKVSPYTQWQKLEVSRLGVDSALYQPRPFRESPEPFTLLAVGRLVPEKGLHILLAALQQLIRENRPVQLRIAGDGPERAGLEQHIAAAGLTRHVALEGWLNRDQVHALYRQTDIYVLSSFLEGIPVVLMEAMVMEIPCIASRITGIPELIQDGMDGLLVTPSDAPELAAAIARLMNDPVLRRRLGEAARRRILADYDLARNTAAFARILERRLTDQLRGSP